MTFDRDMWHGGSSWGQIRRSRSQDKVLVRMKKMFPTWLWMQSIKWKVKVNLGKPVTAQCGEMHAVMTMRRFQCGGGGTCRGSTECHGRRSPLGRACSRPPTLCPMGKHCCLPTTFSASKLIFLPFRIELIRVAMHASKNRFKILYFQQVSSASGTQISQLGLCP